MSPALTEKFEFFIYSQKNNNNESHRWSLSNAYDMYSLPNQDVHIHEDPVDFIIELSDVFYEYFRVEDLTNEQLRYIADKTNEHYGTEYTEDDVQTIIDDFIEAITAE